MDNPDLLKLLELKHLTPAELRQRDPALLEKLEAALRDEARKKLLDSVDPKQPRVRQKIEQVDLKKVPLNDLAKRLRDAAAPAGEGATPAVPDQVLDSLDRVTKIDEQAPVAVNSEVDRLLRKATLIQIGNIGKLDPKVIEKIEGDVPRPQALTDVVLTKLVADKKLNEAQAATLGAAATLFELADEDPKLAQAIRTAAGEDVSGSDWTRKLASLRSNDWLNILRKQQVPVPAGTTDTQLADSLENRFGTLHPDLAFLAHLPQIEVGGLTNHLGNISSVLGKNPTAFDLNFSELDVSQLTPDQRKKAETAHDELRKIVRAYPGLRLDQVLADPQRSPADKAATVARRISLVTKVQARAGEGELFFLDLSPDSPDLSRLGLNDLGAQPDEQKLVLDTIKSYQRMFAITNKATEAGTLIENGYASAVAIATQPLEEFRAKTKSKNAETYWRDARALLIDATATAGSIIDLVAGAFKDINVGNVRPSAKDYLRKLDGFESLFGSLAFCTCAHCQSILSPAAYFVDLMRFVEEHIGPQFGARLNHPLQLKIRRPDLWTLELTCDNTNQRIATLDIVNEILENFIASQRGLAGSLTNRAAVGDLVYRQMLRSAVDSFQQPFHLALARIDRYLEKLESTRADVARAAGASPAIVAAAELHISPEEWQLIIQQVLDTATLNRLYQLTFVAQGAGFSPLDAQELVAAMAIERAHLDEIIVTQLVRAGGANVTVTAEKRSADSVQNDIENVHGLTADALDRMHRFTRLWRHTPWSIPELDRLLISLNVQTLDDPNLRLIATARTVQHLLNISVDETTALVGMIPQTPVNKSLFDRLFNPADVAPADRFPLNDARFVHPSFRTNTAVPADPALPRLLAGLQVDLAGLEALARGLAPHLASAGGTLNPNAANENDRDFVLSAANLTLLYRHARLARLLRLRIEELFQLISIASIGSGRLTNAADILTLIDVATWRRDSGYTMDDLAVATGGAPRDATRYINPVSTAEAIVAGAADVLSFGDTVFSVSLGTTEDASRELLQANGAVVEKTTDDRWRLNAGIDLGAAALVVPPSATVPVPPDGSRPVTVDEMRRVLGNYEPSAIIARALGAAFGFDTAKVEALARLANISLRTEGLAHALRGDGPLDPLRVGITALRPLAVAFQAKEWDSVAIDFVRPQPDRFALVPPAVTLRGLRALSVYTAIAKRKIGTGADARPVDPADIRSALAAFDPGVPGFPMSANEVLGRILDVSPGLIAALRGRVVVPAIAALALEIIDRVAHLASRLGIDGESFAALARDNYEALNRGADALQSAFASRFPDGAERANQLDLLAEPLREKKRDALVAWLVHSLNPRIFRRPSDLYQHFLIDAETGGCSTTSRVVAAISSVQLYIHRIFMNLEQTSPDAPNPLALKMPEPAAAEWTWRKNYRVWEANRKVFLWPENYIEPDLRDDKTSLFKDLENELLQTALTDQEVLDAYTKYLKGLEELATLTVAGVYHDVHKNGDTTTDVFHLFGATSTDPPVFYYRTCENLVASARDIKKTAVWTPWKKIDVQITGRRVAPIIYNGRLYLFWTDYKTRSFNTVQGGASEFAGYRHTMSIRYTMLRPDATWTAPQALTLPFESPFGPSRGVIRDNKGGGNRVRLDFDREHLEPLDDYSLRGTNWDALYLDPNDEEFSPLLNIVGRNYRLYAYVDLFRNSVEAPHPRRDLPGDELGNFPILCARGSSSTRSLWYGHPTFWYPNRNAYADLVLDERRIVTFNLEELVVPLREGLYAHQLAVIREIDLISVAGSIEDAILQDDADVLLLQGSVTDDDSYILRRIGTTLATDVAFRLFIGGVDGLLDIKTQNELREADIPITNLNGIEDRSNAGKLDFKGPYGVYYRELFFHIPFLIANALNGRGNFAAAQRWYHYIFDPTATEVINVPAGTPAAERARLLLDRVWRYREFRKLDQARLREILTDEDALAVYRKDPFNPHAIARLRLSAYQKSIVMKYVDNLLDWADFLFTQFTMESLNEALMLYIMASDILGPRPAQLGDCGEGKVISKNYENIRKEIGRGEEILIEIESWLVGRRGTKKVKPSKGRFALDRSRVNRARIDAPLNVRPITERVRGFNKEVTMAPSALATRPVGGAVVKSDPAEEPAIFSGLSWKETRTGSWTAPLSAARTDIKSGTIARVDDHRGRYHLSDWLGNFGWSIVRQLSPVFCIPVNTDLLEYWNHVEDRLFKIRHCMDITGEKRELALFAPPIDPRLLVRMRAAGLSLEDVLGSTSGDLPPYRFLFLIDRAKAFAASLSSFGGALMSALEKKDGEELGRLRIVQQQNLTRMTTQLRRWEIVAAQEGLAMVERQREAATYRRDYYAELVNQYRSGLESAEAILKHIVTGIHVGESIMDLLSAIFASIPQVGSPFAMKYGGVELNKVVYRFANSASAIAKGLQAAAGSVGIEANFERRAEGWRHQRQLAEHDIRQLAKQISAAEIRLDIANRSLEIHEKSIEQLDEILEFTEGKFSNFGFYTFLSTQLRRLYRGGYQNALALARLAEQAFRFERGDDTSSGLAPTYWDATHSGLLAGEQLLIDLQNLERRYLETNYRSLEVDQTFALSQIAPDAIIALREDGECSFTIHELFFDLFYPGHYKRRIRAVRLTIPSITGPYVNVSATLTLDRSWIRTTPSDGASLAEVPPRRSVSVSTSTAQNDAGVFELSFRDERYMPFEGAGAISRWRLSLPKTFRQFDYQTINDVMLSISYTAEHDGALRDRVETDNATIEGSIRKYLTENSISRMFSLRQDFSSAFARLLHSPLGTEVRIEITDRHFPMFIARRAITVTRSAILLRTGDDVSVGPFDINIDGAPVNGFIADATLGGLSGRPLPGAFTGSVIATHVLRLDNAGGLAPVAPPPGDVSAVDAESLLDVLLYIEYMVTAGSD